MGFEGVADLDCQFADSGDDRLQGRDERQHDLPASDHLELAGASLGAVAQTGEQLAGGLAVECPRGRGHLIAWVCPTRLEGCGVHAKDASAVSRGVPS